MFEKLKPPSYSEYAGFILHRTSRLGYPPHVFIPKADFFKWTFQWILH